MPPKKPRQPSKRVRRRIRFQQILFATFAIILLTSFIVSLFARP
jgi:hypothetical protein